MKEEFTNRKQERKEREISNRFEETRAMEERSTEERPVMNMGYYDPLHVEKADIPPGMEYGWIRVSCYDKPDNKRMVETRRRGWVPVPSTRHPDMVFKDLFGRSGHLDGYIEYSGLILCERRAELGMKEREETARNNLKRVLSLQGIDNLQGEPSIGFKDNTRTTVSGVFG
jgi:hypothetical protein